MKRKTKYRFNSFSLLLALILTLNLLSPTAGIVYAANGCDKQNVNNETCTYNKDKEFGLFNKLEKSKITVLGNAIFNNVNGNGANDVTIKTTKDLIFKEPVKLVNSTLDVLGNATLKLNDSVTNNSIKVGGALTIQNNPQIIGTNIDVDGSATLSTLNKFESSNLNVGGALTVGDLNNFVNAKICVRGSASIGNINSGSNANIYAKGAVSTGANNTNGNVKVYSNMSEANFTSACSTDPNEQPSNPSSPNICFFNDKDNPRDSKFNPVDKAGPNSVGTINISSDGKTISGTVESTNGHDIKLIVVDIQGFSDLIYIEEQYIDNSTTPYKFSKNISGIDPAKTYTYSAYAYTKKSPSGCFQYDFPIVENGTFPTNPPALDFSAKAKEPTITVDSKTGVANGIVEATIEPKGAVYGTANRSKPVDVVVVLDLSLSMNDKIQSNSRVTKLESAKAAAKDALDDFSLNAVDGDRFALVTFSSGAETKKGFNTLTSVNEVNKHISSMKGIIDGLRVGSTTDYTSALTQSYNLLKDSTNNKYVIFLTDGEPTESSKNNVLYQAYIYGGSTKFVPRTMTFETVRAEIRKHGKEQAEILAQKGIKLYSIGFEKDELIDMQYLTQISEITGGTATQGITDEAVSDIFLNITEKINTVSLKDVKVKVKIKNAGLPGQVGLQEGANATIDGDYAVLKFDDIPFTEGQELPQGITKLLPLTFSTAGTYTFNDIKLSYLDFNQVAKSVLANPITFTVNSSPDTTPPVITLNGTTPMQVEKGSTFTDPGATAMDDVDGDLTSKINATSTVDTTKLGEYTVTYTVTDNSGNTATATRMVKVVDTTSPTVTIDGVDNITRNSADIKVSSNESGKLYYIIQPKGQAAPDTTKVKQTGTQLDITSTQQLIINATNLTTNTEYVVYVIAVDDSGNASSVVSTPFKTNNLLGDFGLSVNVKAKQSELIIDDMTGNVSGEIQATITPKGNIPAQDTTTRQTPIDVVFVLDRSTSMNDKIENRSTDSKFKTAKGAAVSAVEQFSEKAVKGDRYALISFENTATVEIGFNNKDQEATAVKSHLTDNSNSLKYKLNNLTSPTPLWMIWDIGYTNYADAFAKANKLFIDSPSTNSKYIIFLTDGKPTVYITSSGNIVNSVKNPSKEDEVKISSKEAVKPLAINGIKLYSIGFEKDSELDMPFLTEISQLTGGTASQSLTDADLERNFQTITNKINTQSIKNIKLKVKIKNDTGLSGTVGIQESGNVTVEGDYAVINIDDVLFNPGAGTPETFDKVLPLTFSDAGKYVFNDIKLTYTNVDGTVKTIEAGPVTFTVKNNIQPISAEGGILTVNVTNLINGATLKLFNNKGEVVATGIATTTGSYTFSNVKPGNGYYVIQYVGGVEKGKSNEVEVLDIVLRFTSQVPKQINIGDTINLLDQKYLTRNPQNTEVTWLSSKQSTIHVDHNTGVITAKSAGYADITVTSKVTGKQATVRIYVKQKGSDDLRW